MNIPVLTGRQFATKFALRPEQFAWFLGAGASASARIPTGYAMIGDFKATLFCQQTGIPRRELDPTDPLWIERINEFFAKQGTLPPAGDPSEYGRAFEAVYPSVEDRRTYIDLQVQRGRPSFAHRVLASLLATSRTPCVFTTNFDNLIETATTVAREILTTGEHRNLVVAAIDSADRAARCVRENDWPLLAKVHGDYQSTALKNIEEELEAQDERMRSVLIEVCRRFALVIVGYSGRDASVMETMTEVLKQKDAFPGGVYWMARSESELLPAVHSFLQEARAVGVDANVLLSQNFDEFAGDIADSIRFEDALERHIHEGHAGPTARPVLMPSQEARNEPILRCSALRVTRLPGVARRLSVQKPASISEVRKLLKNAKTKASIAVAGNDYAIFGNDDEIMAALAELTPKLVGTIKLDPVQDSWALGLIYDALVKALCKGRPLHPRLKGRGHSILISAGHVDDSAERRSRRLHELDPLKTAYGVPLTGQVPALGYPFSEALQIRLEHIAGQWWCVFDPYTNVDLPLEHDDGRALEASTELVSRDLRHKPNPAADWLRERWAQRYNKKWAAMIDAWSQMLAGEVRAFWIEEERGIDAVFEVGPVTAWSRPSHDHPYFHRSSR